MVNYIKLFVKNEGTCEYTVLVFLRVDLVALK